MEIYRYVNINRIVLDNCFGSSSIEKYLNWTKKSGWKLIHFSEEQETCCFCYYKLLFLGEDTFRDPGLRFGDEIND